MIIKNSAGYLCPYFCSYCWQMQVIAWFYFFRVFPMMFNLIQILT